jgi:hypothetical protein
MTEYTFGDGLTRHRNARAAALAVFAPLYRMVGALFDIVRELEWQCCRLDTWLRDDQ